MKRGAIVASIGLAIVLGGAYAVTKSRPRVSKPAPPPSASAQTYRQASRYEISEVILDGKLAKGWEDWGWGAHAFPDGGTMSVDFGAYGGVIFHHAEMSSRFGALIFRYKAGSDENDFLRVALKSGQLDEKTLPFVNVGRAQTAVVEDGWREVMIPWAALNPTGVSFDRIVIQASRFVASGPVTLDRIELTKPTAGIPAGRAPARKASLSIHCDQKATRISPLIYGVAGDVWSIHATARRMGGNPMSRFNWDLGAWNTGNDWYFENIKIGTGLASWLADDVAHGVKTALVVPTIGWVAKDGTSVGFPVEKFGQQRARDPNRPSAGDGHKPGGEPIAPGPPTETSVASPPELIRKWVAALRENDRAKGIRSVDMYILDNEPNLWNSTHRDVHPEPLSYDELLDRTIRYAKAIRSADSDAVIAGPAEWGWTGYFYSAKDNENGRLLRLDRRAHGDVPLLPWYLKKLQEHEKSTGTRLLDVVDVHFYPQVPGIYGNGARTDSEASALRIRSTRSLWDPTYKDESWIADTVRLIPRVKAWIAENYPGRGISIGEWSFGAEEHMSGGLAVAEVLGRFGQQGITSAFYWVCPAEGTPAFQAFRAYRNFDGKGASFLDWSIPTSDAQSVSLFASRNDSGSRIVAVLLNLEQEVAADAEIDASTCGETAALREFEYRDGAAGFVERRAAASPAGTKRGVVTTRVEPYSIKVLDLSILTPQLR